MSAATTMSVTAHKHPWKLVGPWYRWTRAGIPSDGRTAPPAIQKFSSDDFVNEFIKDPQHSLKYDDDIDQVYAVDYEPVTALTTEQLAGKFATIYPRDKNGDKNPSRVKLVPMGTRKLFLPTHSRHYLVTCELHCDFAGFPSAKREEVCQVGFVVRRKFLSYPESARPFAAKQLKEIVTLQAKLAELDETSPLRPRAAKRRADKMLKLKQDGTFDAKRADIVAQLAEARGTLEKWRSANGVHSVLQGWMPGDHERIGEWRIVDDQPQVLTEAWSPMFPLIADPNDPKHDATGRTMYFGLIPVTSFETDVNGKARFDDDSIYEIRCFVRRHNDCCPRKVDAVPDCQGELVWSRPTERYQIASQFDLEGTSNRPITIKMPNLAELAAQAVKRPFGKYSPVKFIQPQGLSPKIDGTALGDGSSMGGFQICFFSIPLITIVALFVLNIFLPIVVFIFGLWFLLAFKFCIPPSIDVDLGLQAELDVAGGFGLDADFSIDVDLPQFPDIPDPLTAFDVNVRLNETVSADIAEILQAPVADIKADLGQYSNLPLADLNSNNVEVANLPDNVEDDPPIVDFSAGLEYETHREVGDGAGA